LLTALLFRRALAQSEVRLKACATCHGTDGNSSVPGTPSIAAQPRIFLENYLVLTREGIRGTDVMQALLKGVPDKEIIALSVFFSKLKARIPEGKTDQALFNKGKSIASKKPVRELPQRRLPWARADAAPRGPARGVPRRGHAAVPPEPPTRRRHVDGCFAVWHSRGGFQSAGPLLFEIEVRAVLLLILQFFPSGEERKPIP
jgi:cytochrome c553